MSREQLCRVACGPIGETLSHLHRRAPLLHRRREEAAQGVLAERLGGSAQRVLLATWRLLARGGGTGEEGDKEEALAPRDAARPAGSAHGDLEARAALAGRRSGRHTFLI